MALPRRSFLKIFSALPLAPVAVKDALASAGISGAGLGSVVGSVGSVAVGHAHSGALDETTSATWLLANGIPEFVVDAMRRDYRVPNGLDPDLAANRSFSLSAKVRIQRERDLQRRCADTIERQRTVLKKAALRKVTGLDFWW